MEPIFYGGTLGGRLVAVAARDDMTAAARLDALVNREDEDLRAQREQAWTALSVGVEWAARALDSVGVEGTDTTPVRDSEAAFARGQHLDRQVFKLSQLQGRHDRAALLVDAVKLACYAAAELGPIQGGRLAVVRRPTDQPAVPEEVAPRETDLLELGSQLGEALYRLNELGLGDVVTEATRALTTVSDARSERLAQSKARVAERLIEEGLRAEEHPSIVFRSGPTGRRAGIAGGPDVWEIVRDLKAATAEGASDPIGAVAHISGLERTVVESAAGYYACLSRRRGRAHSKQ